MTLTLDFVLHGQRGAVTVTHHLNNDPHAVGFPLLRLDFDDDDMIGFPVVEATTHFDGQGYRALMGWIQVVRYTSPGDGDQFIVDTAPQFKGLNLDFPFLAWGMRPSLFDAPATVEHPVDWWADAFLVASPDALMTPVIGPPLCAFRWGYQRNEEGVVTSRPPTARDTGEAWAEVVGRLRKLHPGWTFQ